MSLQDRLKPFLKILKYISIFGGGTIIITYHVKQTHSRVNKIVNTSVLDAEKKCSPEYIYIDDPSYEAAMKAEHDSENKQSVGFSRIWKSLKYSLAWKLLWLCRHGSKEQRNVALEHLAAFKNNKSWDCLKLAQALDKDTAILLARTRGADLRYFLPPPIHIRRTALTSELLSFRLRDLLMAVQNVNPHSCIHYFLTKYFLNIQEQPVDVDLPNKPDNISEKDLCILCLDALHHHLSLFYQRTYEDDLSTQTLVKQGILQCLAELLLRHHNDIHIDIAVLKVLTILSVHSNLSNDFFQNGLIRDLSRLLRSNDVRLASSAAVCLANLSGEYLYQPGLYLLYPLYRTSMRYTCDTLLVHGLRGGVFVTWRQRDRSCFKPIGILEVSVSDTDCDPCKENETEAKYYDPELQQVLEDIMEIEEESLLSDVEVVLHDIPIDAKREPNNKYTLTANKKRSALIQEDEDKCNYTFCWPKDWLPKDCRNLRILGINYWSSLSEWLEHCPLQNSDIATRASELIPKLVDAGVGKNKIVWLTHSMGGLIVKQLLNETSECKDMQIAQLSQYTKAILFYSTPHKGSALATMPRAAAAILWPSQDVKQLQENSPVLLKIHQDFITYAERFGWETISFAETLPTPVTAFKVPIHFVEPYSADLGRGMFYQLPLDHLSICKPATRQSVLYTTVLDLLTRVIAEDVELHDKDSYIQRFVDYLLSTMRSKIKSVIEILDEAQSADRLHSIEKALTQTFSEDFIE